MERGTKKFIFFIAKKSFQSFSIKLLNFNLTP